MKRRWLLAVFAATPALAFAAPAAATQLPNSMAAIGDSLTAGFNSHVDTWHIPAEPDLAHCPTGFGPFGAPSATFGLDCPAHSWATGTGVNSIYMRIRAKNPAIAGHAYNYAVSAAPAALLPAQAQLAAGPDQRAELVTVLIGANDACVPFQPDGTPTPLQVFAAQFQQAMNILSAAPSHPRILVASIPDIYQLWQLFHRDPNAVLRWTYEVLCPPLFDNAMSAAPARRAAFRLRIAAYNLIEQQICRQTPRCETDGGALFRTQLTPADVATLTNTGGIDAPPYNTDVLRVIGPPMGAIPNSTADFVHPSVAGQNRVAEIVWAASSLSRAG
jgi:lysophospholipase L1-like esterase